MYTLEAASQLRKRLVAIHREIGDLRYYFGNKKFKRLLNSRLNVTDGVGTPFQFVRINLIFTFCGRENSDVSKS
jgi:hypothetical protein